MARHLGSMDHLSDSSKVRVGQYALVDVEERKV